MPTPTTYVPKQLAAPAQLPNAAATLYTVPGATTTQLTSLILVNTDTAPHTVSIHLGAAAASNALCYNFVIPADGLPYELVPVNSQGIYIPAASVIQGVADAASKVTYIISGVELS